MAKKRCGSSELAMQYIIYNSYAIHAIYTILQCNSLPGCRRRRNLYHRYIINTHPQRLHLHLPSTLRSKRTPDSPSKFPNLLTRNGMSHTNLRLLQPFQQPCMTTYFSLFGCRFECFTRRNDGKRCRRQILSSWSGDTIECVG